MSTARKRLDSLEERRELQQARQFKLMILGRSELEMRFFCVHGYWPESVGDELPSGTEFTVRGIKTIVITQWEEKKE
ncbi:MAG TPA: hypothetical protein VII23_24195 [Terriglobales bacterium]